MYRTQAGRGTTTRVSLAVAMSLAVVFAACSKPAEQATSTPAAAAGDQAGPADKVAPAAAAAPASSAAAAPRPAAKPAPPPKPEPRRFTLAAGAPLKIELAATLSTKSAKPGDEFLASLVDPIVDGTWVIAAAGSRVEGVVVRSTEGGRVRGVAELEIAVTKLTLADGQVVAVTTIADATQAKTSKGQDAKKIAITTGIGAAIGAIAGGGKGAAIGAGVGAGGGTALVLGTKGEAAQLPAKTVLVFTVKEPVEIVEKM